MVRIMRNRKVIASLAAAGMVVSLLGTTQPTMTQAATKLKVSVSKCVLKVGQTKTISANKKVTWKSSDKKVVAVKKVNGKKVKITAKKKGTCKVIASVGKKKAVIKVTVQKAKTKATATPTVTPGTVSNGSVTTDPTVNPSGTLSTDTQIYMNETCGVSISMSDVKTTSGTITIQNNSGSEVVFGLEYFIQKYENAQWTTLTSNPVAIPAVALGVLNGGTYTNKLDWASSYGSLPQGTYRVVKKLSVGGQNKTIASQFVIDGNTEIGATSVPMATEAAGSATGGPTVATAKPATNGAISTAPQTPDPAYMGPVHTLTPEEKEELEHAIPADDMPMITAEPTTPQEIPQIDSQVYMDEVDGVSIQLSDIKTTDGTLTITNNSGNDVTFDMAFCIQKYENSQWTTLTAKPVTIPAIAILGKNGETYTRNLNWSFNYGSLPQGTYRLIKQISVYGYGNGTKKIASQFVIDENTEIGATIAPMVTEPAGTITEGPTVATAAPAVTPAVATAVPVESATTVTTAPAATPVPVQNTGK